jgi:hypothetical protein
MASTRSVLANRVPIKRSRFLCKGCVKNTEIGWGETTPQYTMQMRKRFVATATDNEIEFQVPTGAWRGAADWSEPVVSR